MKINLCNFAGALLVVTALINPDTTLRAQTAAPKRFLEVSVTKGYRHASIATGHKVLEELATNSGVFTLDRANTDAEMAAKMTPAALKNYDGVFFNSTTGDLPLPDKQAFLDWIKSGKAFIGVHAATDTFHGPPNGPVDPYIEMIGAEFDHHNVAPVVCLNEDPTFPANVQFGKTFAVTDEIYIYKNFSRNKVHMLLSLDKLPGGTTPGYYPISWCKKYGQGNVFYCALGHEDAVWRNPEFQAHILGGIKWALGLVQGDATPQTK